MISGNGNVIETIFRWTAMNLRFDLISFSRSQQPHMWDETWILIENSPVFRQQSERYSIKNWQCLRLLLLLLYNKFSNFTSILSLSKNLNAATRKRVREPHHLSSNRTIPPQKLYFFSSFPIPLLLCLPLFGRFLRAYRISFFASFIGAPNNIVYRESEHCAQWN